MKEVLMSKAALHVHTNKGDGLASPTQMVEIAKEKGFSVIAVTDHNTIDGTEEAQEAGKKLGIYVIPGEEITSGMCLFPPIHVVALGIHTPIPPFQGIDQTLIEIKKQRGLVVIPHPNYGSATPGKMHKNIENIDAVEQFNGKLGEMNLKRSLKGEDLCQVALVAGSDAHFPEEFDAAYTLFPGKSIEDLFEAIKNKTTVPFLNPHKKINIKKELLLVVKGNLIEGPKNVIWWLKSLLHIISNH